MKTREQYHHSNYGWFIVRHGIKREEYARDRDGEEAEACTLVRGIREDDLWDAVCKKPLSNSLALLHWAVLKYNWKILLLSEIADTFITQYN